MGPGKNKVGDLRTDSPKIPDGMVKSFMDLQENIESYGGDRNNVTIFGESAGSCSVESLLCSSKATGLFHRAICQSGTLKTYKITVWDLD